jgi:hypothetical protein
MALFDPDSIFDTLMPRDTWKRVFFFQQPPVARTKCRVFPTLSNLNTEVETLSRKGRSDFAEEEFLSARPCVLCSAVSQLRRALRRFSRSADSLVREFRKVCRKHANKAVRAPLAAALPGCAFALIHGLECFS